MTNAKPLSIPKEVSILDPADHLNVSEQEIRDIQVAIDTRWQQALAPSYCVEAAKQAGPSITAAARDIAGEEAGADWGTIIHMLLEMAIRHPEANLAPVAKKVIRDLGHPDGWAGTALETVQKVLASKIWQRADRSRRRLVEVPFTLERDSSETGVPILQRGVIDLAFEEDDGWVIVDYKTDSVAPGNLDAFVHHYRPQLQAYAAAWKVATGLPVKESGLYFIRADQYLVVDLEKA